MHRMIKSQTFLWQGLLAIVIVGGLSQRADAGGYVYRAKSYYVVPPYVGLYSPLFLPPPIYVVERPVSPIYPPVSVYPPVPVNQPVRVLRPGVRYNPDQGYNPGPVGEPGEYYQPGVTTPSPTPVTPVPAAPFSSNPVPSNRVPSTTIPTAPMPIAVMPRTVGYLTPVSAEVIVPAVPPVQVRVVETWRSTPYRSVYRYRATPVPYRVWTPTFLGYVPVVW